LSALQGLNDALAKIGGERLHTLRIAQGQPLREALYLEKTGCQWRLLPKDFPDWGLVWQYFRRFRDDGNCTDGLVPPS
jgi:transposase